MILGVVGCGISRQMICVCMMDASQLIGAAWGGVNYYYFPLQSLHHQHSPQRPVDRIVRRFLAEMLKRLRYGVATMSRLLKTIGLFCRISSLL